MCFFFPTALSLVAFTPYGKYKPLTQTSNSSYWFISRTYFPTCSCVIDFLVNLNVRETYVHYSGPSYIQMPFQNSWSKINFHIKYWSTGTNFLKHSSGLNQICKIMPFSEPVFNPKTSTSHVKSVTCQSLCRNWEEMQVFCILFFFALYVHVILVVACSYLTLAPFCRN